MKKQSIIRIIMIVTIVTAAAFVVSATRSSPALSNKEECTQQEENECVEKKNQTEFLLENLTRNLLR